MSQTIWQRERIAPLEFCSIQRASEILKCSTEDLMHLGKIGAIELCVLIKNLPSTLMIRGFPRKKDFDDNSVKDKFNSIGLKTDGSLYFDKDDPFTRFKIEREVTGTFRHYAGHSERMVLLSGLARGLWALPHQTVERFSKDNKEKVKTLYPERHLLFQKSTDLYPVLYLNELFKPVKDRLFDGRSFSMDDLLLSRRTINNIYEAMDKGVQLPNFVNGGLSGEWLTNSTARGDIKITGISSDFVTDSVNLNGCLHIMGEVIHALKNTSIPSKRWTQDALKNEILERNSTLGSRKLDEYFSAANKHLKSMI